MTLVSSQSFRGFLQSSDGCITRVLTSGKNRLRFNAAFKLSEELRERLKSQAEHLIFSERSRIARLGIQIENEPPSAQGLEGDTVVLTLSAMPVIPNYPGMDILKEFFLPGLPVGRLVFCDPEALLTSEQVMDAMGRGALKLPASTAISSDGSIFIAPHKVVYEMKSSLDRDVLGRILLRQDGRELLNFYQVQRKVAAVTIPPAKGVITTCSMYLNEHYVVLQNGKGAPLELGHHLPATILDPIKTRGVRIYLEIVNSSRHPIVNPLISAKVFGSPKVKQRISVKGPASPPVMFSYPYLRQVEKRLADMPLSTCHYLNKPAALMYNAPGEPEDMEVFMNGPEAPCQVSTTQCMSSRRDFSTASGCPHIYATGELDAALEERCATLILKYFPNLLEHRDIVNLASRGRLKALYFFEPSFEHGPFLSQSDHNRLQEYHAFGLDVYWVSGLNQRLMFHTMRDRKGYFVAPERLADFHKSMLFAFYGSNRPLSDTGKKRLGALMDALIEFWGLNIGIVTGGGSGVMEEANTLARKRGILSGANFLDITDQAMTTDVDFCQVFQASCRHSRQKWFEITSFPIFNVGGLGTLEELGITLCNMKLSIAEPVPIILFDTEGRGRFWDGMQDQIIEMVRQGRAPAWAVENIVMTDEPQVVIAAYRERLQLL